MNGGLFYPNEDIDEKAEERQREEEAKELAHESLQIAELASNDIFPDFLWSVQVNDFETDDNYKIRATNTNPSVQRAYTIGRKYQNYWDYLEALDAYQEYSKYIESMYGSFDMMRRAAKDGYSNIFIPPIPKLTHKKKNRLIMETGFMPSKVEEDFYLDEEVFNEALQSIKPVELDEEDTPIKKRDKRIYENMIRSKAKADRVNTIFTFNTSSEYRQGMDAIVNYLTSSNRGDILERNNVQQSLSEQIDELHEYDGIPDEIVDDMLDPTTAVIKDGMYQNKRQTQLVEILETLEKNGFDFLFSSATKGIDKGAVRAFRRQFMENVDFSKLSKKQRKKIKKKMFQKKKDERDTLLGERRLQKMLLGNRISLSRENSMGLDPKFLNFHLSDAFPEED